MPGRFWAVSMNLCTTPVTFSNAVIRRSRSVPFSGSTTIRMHLEVPAARDSPWSVPCRFCLDICPIDDSGGRSQRQLRAMHSMCSANPPLRSPASPPRWRRSPSLPPPLPQQPAAIETASPGPGAAQRLVDSLEPGQVGCLHGGTYAGNVKVTTAGITLTRFGAEHATLKGRFWIARGADGVTVAGPLPGRHQPRTPFRRPTVNADDATFRRNDVTNNHRSICFDLGHPDWGRADDTRIELNRIHDCGRLPATNHDHGIYVAVASNTLIRGNWIYDNADYGIQLYPNAQNSRVVGNVIDGNGEGITFSGEYGVTSNGNLVEGNVIANSRVRNNVESWFARGNPIGRGNVVRNNCIKGGVYDRGNGGIGDQWGFRVVEHDPHAGDLRGPLPREDFRLDGGQRLPRRDGRRLPQHRPRARGPARRPCQPSATTFPPRDLRSGPPDRPPRPPPALHRPGRERAPRDCTWRSSPAATATAAGWPGSRSAPTEPSPCARACARRARPASSASEPWCAESDTRAASA